MVKVVGTCSGGSVNADSSNCVLRTQLEVRETKLGMFQLNGSACSALVCVSTTVRNRNGEGSCCASLFRLTPSNKPCHWRRIDKLCHVR